MKNKKMIALVLASSVLIVSLSGCSSSSGTKTSSIKGVGITEPGAFPIVEGERPTITVLAPDEGHILDLNTNEFTLWYEEKTNIDIEFIQIPKESFVEKRNLMITSNELPDVILSGAFSKSDEVTYGGQGIFLPLNDLIKEQGYYINEVFEQQEDLPMGITTPDGNIYGLPRINEAYHTFYDGKAWINQEWLDNLELEYPTTTDELYDVLKAFKENDPNGNGIADEIPMTGADNGWNTRVYDFLMNSFIYNDYTTRVYVDNGKVEFAPVKESWRDGLTYIKKLYDEGLIQQESITQTDEQYSRLSNNPDDVILGVAVGGNITYASGSSDFKREKYFKPLSPLKGTDGVQYAKTAPIGYSTGHFIITSNCENPELAFRWAEGMYNEEVTIRSERGLEGVKYEQADGDAIGIDGNPAKWSRIIDQEPASHGESNDTIQNIGLTNLTAELRLSEALNTEDPEAKYKGEAILYSSTKDYYEPYAVEEYVLPRAMYFTDDELDGYARISVQLQDYVLESMVAFITGSLDLENDWDKYIENIENLELGEYLEKVQSAYDRTK